MTKQTYAEELNIKKEKLENLIPQLIDLKNGFLDELTLRKGENADLLFEVIQDGIDRIDNELRISSIEK